MVEMHRSRKRRRHNSNGGPDGGATNVHILQTSPHLQRGNNRIIINLRPGQDHDTIQSSTTIHVLKQSWGFLWPMALLCLGCLTLPTSAAVPLTAAATNPDAKLRRLVEENKQQADEHIRKLFQEPSSNDCIDVIVTLASAHGNIDPILDGLGDAAHYERTNAVAMPCISMELHDNLLASPEVLLVEHDAAVHAATTTEQQDLEMLLNSQVTFINGEAVPWGADLVLQSSWEEIPDPDPNGDNFTLCVVDSGLLVSHQDIPFEENGTNIMGMEFDLETGVLWSKPVADAFHGTHTVGTMLATGYNEEGLRGIIPRNEKFRLLIARVFGDGMVASAKISTIDKAIEWCADNGARIINLSLASASATVNSQLLYSQIVEQEGVLLVAASGNQGTMSASYPAGYDHVISVGSIEEDLTKSDFSQYGPSLDLMAPGRDVYSTVPSSGLEAEDSELFEAGPMTFTPVHNYPISGEIVDCGLGDVVCGNATGQVCLVEHSLGLPFQTLAENCEYGGGVSLVVYPGLGGESLDNAVMDLEYTGSISVVTVSRDNGLRLLAKRGTLASLSFTVPAYKTVTGTSMSAAHVSALAAKVWAARPGCTNSQIREALEVTALDLGAAGRDDVYGHGLVQGVDAYQYLLSLPEPCGTASADSFPHPLGNPDRPVTLRKPRTEQPGKQKICNEEINPFCHRVEEQRRQRRSLRKVIQ